MRKIEVWRDSASIMKIENRVQELSVILNDFYLEYNKLNIGELATHELAPAVRQTKDFILGKLKSKIDKLPEYAGIPLQKDSIVNMLDINLDQIVRAGEIARNMSMRTHTAVEKFYKIDKGVKIDRKRLDIELQKFYKYAETEREQEYFVELENLCNAVNSFNEYVKENNPSDLDVTGANGHWTINDWLAYDRVMRAFEIPLKSYNNLIAWCG